jgi:hypothetical protein
MNIPPQYLRIASLIATQPHLHTEALTTTPPPTRGIDPIVHVVRWQGKDYIEDGHHRVVREALRGYSHVLARVYEAIPSHAQSG